MNFDLGSRAESFRTEVRDFLNTEFRDEMREQAWRSGTNHDWDFHRALAERRWIAPAWPTAYGGQDRHPYEVIAMNEEFDRVGAPIVALRATLYAADTIRHAGTEEQKTSVVADVLKGKSLICLGYSEPDSGSDVAAARTRATRDEDGWVINGQKMFTSFAHIASYVFLLARTNTDVPNHRGLTVFLVPMDSPGVEVRPVRTLGGQLTNLTFYRDVRIPDSARVGPVDGGWGVLTIGLALERLSLLGPGEMIAKTAAWACAPDARGKRPIDEPRLRAELTRGEIDAEVCKLLCYRNAWIIANDLVPGVEGSMSKLFSSEATNLRSSRLIDALGPEGLRSYDSPGAPAGGNVEHHFRHAPFTSIAGGTSEIQRSIIAERGLKLPRSR